MLFVLPNIQATHIVGGEITYTCIGQNPDGSSNFEVELRVFRDCINGRPNFDSPASIGIFDASNGLVTSLGNGGELRIPFDPAINDTLDPVLSNPCLVVPPDVCVHTTFYQAEITLPFRPGGYQLAYQRCCRNKTILNITRPDSTGATYSVNIGEEALIECNTSAKFKEWPPIYICAFEPIDFDQSAIDPDGDSIVYRLCTPQEGGDATSAGARPQPPNNPPYDTVVWRDPPFNLLNMLNGTPNTGEPLRINSETGLLTGIPTTVGQFVVGICLEEYRDGNLISTTRRDFQFNVGICDKTISSFFSPLIQCDSLTVEFDNESQNADTYFWDFGDPGQPGATSTERNPSFTFSDTGRYTIMLIADPNSICSDTSFREVYLQFPSLTADFEFEFVECSDSMVIEVRDASTDSISIPSVWEWTLTRGGQELAVSADQNPTFVVDSDGSVNLSLIVTAANGCVRTLEQSFEIDLIDFDLPSDSILICIGDSVELNANAPGGFNYVWSPDENITNATDSNPIVFPTTTTIYRLALSDTVGICAVDREVKVEVPPLIDLGFPADTAICNPSLELTANSQAAQIFFWYRDSLRQDIISVTNSIEVTPFGEETYYLVVQDNFGCERDTQVTIIGNGVNVDLDAIPLFCLGDSVELSVNNLDSRDTLIYDWQPSGLVRSGRDGPNPTVSPDLAGETTFYLSIENQFGCLLEDSITVFAFDTLPQNNLVAEQQCGGFNVSFSHNGVNAPYYTWFFNDPAQPGASSTDLAPVFEYSDTGSYTVILVPDAECADTVELEIELVEPQINVDFDWVFETCGDSLVIVFSDSSTNTQSSFTTREWSFSNGQNDSAAVASVILNNSQDLIAQLILNSDDGCSDTLSQIIPVRLIEANLADSLLICPGEQVGLNPGGDSTYTYNWSPTTGLDNPQSPNPIFTAGQSMQFSVTISDQSFADCSIVRTVDITVPSAINLQFLNDTTICRQNILLQAPTSKPVTYEWSESPDFDPLAGTQQFYIAFPGRPTTYYVRVTDEFGCTETDEVTIFSSSPQLADDTLFYCQGSTLELGVENLDSADVLTYSWSDSEDPLENGDVPNPMVTPIGETRYFVVATNQLGCEATASVLVIPDGNQPPLTVNPVLDTIFQNVNSTVQLTATQDDDYVYEWEPGGSLSATDIYNPIASPTETTDYTVTVTDSDGCTNRASLRIVFIDPICELPNIFIPNAFSPNDDGENDDFRVYGNFVEEIHLMVFDRWGKKVFETRQQDQAWDGRLNGKALTTQVFGYYLFVRCIDGDEFVTKGNVTLLR